MGKFSDNVRKQLKQKEQPTTIEFSCGNCLNLFVFTYADICLNSLDDIEFTPQPACPKCGSTVDLVFTDYSQEMIENRLFSNQIKRCK